MPSKEVYNLLLKEDIITETDRYSKYDTLADKSDLECLFEVLQSVKDGKGKPAVMTPVTNIANPDFKRIKESDFIEYFYEPFTETLMRYGRDPDTFNTWKKGMELGIFVPESHGREHVSVHFWLQALREGNDKLRLAFDNDVVSVNVKGMHPVLNAFRPEFYFNSRSQLGFLMTSISEGTELFREIFGYTPRAFVPGNNIFHPVFEETVAEAGIKYLYISHFNSIPDGAGNLRRKYYPVGRKALSGLRYYTRNCAFEPTDPAYHGIDLTLKQIEAAFRWGKPANISTHRVNFIGAIEKSNREKGLRELSLLLKTIVRKWPDVEFMSSEAMFKALYK
ncbi:hypothetical protein EG832_21110, partial [bacterium]|nr:hypothetical protein [bacterium]